MQKTLVAAAKSGLKRAHRATDPTEELRAAYAEHQDEMLWVTWTVLIELVRAVHGRALDEDQAADLLVQLATHRDVRHRFASMMANGLRAGSADRMAMLATGFLVGAEETAMRDRLDFALGGLFPEDAATLGMLRDLEERLDGPMRAALVANDEILGHGDYFLLATSVGGAVFGEAVAVSRTSIYGLDRSGCIALGSFVQTPEFERIASVEILPVGFELLNALESVPWQEIARRAEDRRRRKSDGLA